MPPSIALLITLAFVAWLFRRDFREKPNVTRALWIPYLWVFLSGTRFASEWMSIFGLRWGGGSADEGSPLDGFVFFGLIGAGLYVLHQRRISLAEFIRNNQWVTIYLAYCLLAVLWSDFPLVAFKRWIKLFGQPVMVLIILTEPDPMEALSRLFKRSAYVWVPVSILFIRYFPALGRGYDSWNGLPMDCGITLGKNALGFDSMILGFFFFWHFLQVWQRERSLSRRNDLVLCLFFLAMNGWLLHLAHSSTSIGTLVLAIAMMLFLGLKFVDARRIGFYLATIFAICALAELFFGIHHIALQALNRDSTLTGRTDIWKILLHWDLNPIFGTGFESFWTDERATKVAKILGVAGINEAHNGYLEIYINLGLLGLAVTFAMVWATYLKARQALIYDFNFGRFRLTYLVSVLVYNWTEAAFRTHSVAFFVFFLVAIDYPKFQFAASEQSLDPDRSED